jgi:hypothetical protein
MTESNGVLALDAATLGTALVSLTAASGNETIVPTDDPTQARFLRWLLENHKAVQQLEHLKTLVSRNVSELNQFLQDNGFPPMFRGGGLGAVTILDMLVQWAITARLTRIGKYHGGQLMRWKAFALGLDGVEMFDTPASRRPLV